MEHFGAGILVCDSVLKQVCEWDVANYVTDVSGPDSTLFVTATRNTGQGQGEEQTAINRYITISPYSDKAHSKQY